MKYELIEEKLERGKLTRIYRNPTTGTESKTQLIYTDKEGGRWWGFPDLYKIPMIRKAMAKNIMDLYNINLTRKDLLSWCSQEKVLLKSDDPERYEKLYSLILEKERVINVATDIVTQHLALASVYVLEDQERIDYFDQEASEHKFNTWKAYPELVSFFLNWLNEITGRYMKALEKISQTASKILDRETTKEF